eukprot:CAMPEP_0198537326 /NCGR_PEP_ID=MMETSP1462-20131121/43659_1 /TAXON_ID=1333877 /ORGANISM="Brandtodinium nutriculum, Strain RCC3387" /LENGTH=138 /DNA_ID=CAMNT_0044267311 /DNA_START=59 /DNA_END=475 /DNA_ORIENTATION=-
MAPALKVSGLLACVAHISSASLQSGAIAAEGSVALRGTANASGRPTLLNMTLPVAAMDCPKTQRDESLMESCLQQDGCAWSFMSGCRDWSDRKFCSGLVYKDCWKEVIYHGGYPRDHARCEWVNRGLNLPPMRKNKEQ